LDVVGHIEPEPEITTSMEPSFLALVISIPSSAKVGRRYVYKDSSLVVDSLKVELNLLVAPFIRDLKLRSEPGVLD
jgi:hypothetical protein